MAENGTVDVRGLVDWLDACPTPFHSVDRAVAELTAAGFGALQQGSELPERTKDARRSEGGALRAELLSIRVSEPWDADMIGCPTVC
ncbi:MAG: hypothetical protein ACKOQ7_12345, partial [Actinomycetota bacterium]